MLATSLRPRNLCPSLRPGRFALVISLLSIFFTALFTPAIAQSRNQGQVVLKVSVKGGEDSRPVRDFGLLVQRVSKASPETALSSLPINTAAEGTASLTLSPGDYVVKSERPLVVGDRAYEWSVPLKVEAGRLNALELTDENATVVGASDLLKMGRITAEEDILSILSGGAVTVQGELGYGTGFIVSDTGLVLAPAHLLRNSKELRVQFDRDRKVRAELLATDPGKDLAALRVNLASCTGCKPLAVTKQGGETLRLSEGERIFTLGSPLGGSKTLSSGVIRRLDDQTIASDIKINPDNLGGPVLNARGEVVGMSGLGPQAGGAPDAPRVIRIEAARELLAKAERAVREAPAPPPPDLLPVEPADTYPEAALKSKVDIKRFEAGPYRVDAGKYQVVMLTPVLKYYIVERDRAELAKWQAKHKDEAVMVGPGRAINSFQNLRNWADYVSRMRPVVHVVAVPEVKATGKSLFFGILTAGLGAMGGSAVFPPLDFKFKADFEEMLLMCDGKPLTPIQRGKIEYAAPMQSYFKIKTRSAYAGVYTYPADAFSPDRCRQLELQLFSEENPAAPEKKLIESRTAQRVWGDFDDYRRQPAGKQ